MPKLNEQQQAVAAESEGGFTPVDEGRYVVVLEKVTESAKAGPSGHKYWTWEFKIDEPGVRAARLWHNTSLSPDAAFKIREVYDALGYTLDSDTAEMIGDKCRAYVSTQTQEQGKNAGRLQNVIDSLVPLEDPAGTSEDPWQAG